MTKKDTRPTEFKMAIEGTILEALGVNLYSSIGKCLVEFAANSFDSDASYINISIPFDTISEARKVLREAAKKKAPKSRDKKFSPLMVQDPLPKEIEITIEDDGHGMSAEEIQEKFLPLNRNRREGTSGANQTNKTESGKRHVMGRKGLGKLAAFGVAQRVTIYSKRSGSTYATQFTMDYDVIRKNKLHLVPFKPTYFDGLPLKNKGTKITLNLLRCDSVAAGAGGVGNSIRDSFFGISEKEFSIKINEIAPENEDVSYEFIYPDNRESDGLAKFNVNIPDDMGSFGLSMKAMFRAPVEGKRVHLSGVKRGARIYCNGRLAAGPTLADVHSGIHNFGATAYLEVIARADELDDLGVDLINTNRTDFRRDNDVVSALLSQLTDFMTKALAAHSKWRDAESERAWNESPIADTVEDQIMLLPAKARTAARKVVKLLAKAQGVNSPIFRETVPLVLQSVNTGDVLVKLLEMENSNPDLKEIIRELGRLAEIEKSDALKLYRGRRGAITAMHRLIKKGDDTWKKNPQFENELHALLAANPWILAEEYGKYLTSDQQMATTIQRLEKTLKINKNSPALKADNRPDLVFLLGDSLELTTVIIVELKSPNIPLRSEHWNQLEGYINEIELFLKSDSSKSFKVSGYLVGTLADQNTRNTNESLILKKHKDTSHQTQIRILTPMDLVDHAMAANQAILAVLEAEDLPYEEDMDESKVSVTKAQKRKGKLLPNTKKITTTKLPAVSESLKKAKAKKAPKSRER